MLKLTQNQLELLVGTLFDRLDECWFSEDDIHYNVLIDEVAHALWAKQNKKKSKLELNKDQLALLYEALCPKLVEWWSKSELPITAEMYSNWKNSITLDYYVLVRKVMRENLCN